MAILIFNLVIRNPKYFNYENKYVEFYNPMSVPICILHANQFYIKPLNNEMSNYITHICRYNVRFR